VLAPLRVRNFRRLWVGQALSALGDPIFPFAIAFYVLSADKGASGVGLVFGARALAGTAAVLFGGVMADRVRRTRVMMGADLVRAVAMLAIALYPGAISIGVMSVLVFVVGLGEGVFRPAYSALVPSVLPAELVQAGNSVTTGSKRVAAFAGPAIAGLLVAWLGPDGALAVDAATFGVSLITLIGVNEPPGQAPSKKPSLLSEAREGFRAVLNRRWIAVEIGVSAAQIFLSFAPWFVLLPVVSFSNLGGEGAYGLLLTAMGLGSLLGAFLGGRIHSRRPGVVACLALLPFSVALVGLAIDAPLAFVLVLHFAAGIGVDVYSVLWDTAVQRDVPNELLGRVFAIDELGSLALLPIGMVVFGALAEDLGAAMVLGVAALVNVVTAVVPLVLPDVRRFSSRWMPDAEREAPVID
jgi:MFS family permease